MQRWTRALVLPTYVMCTPYMQLYFPTMRQDFHRNAQNSMCMHYFSADELTTGVKKHATTAQIYCSFAHVYSSPEFGGWSNEQLRHPLYTIIGTMFSHVSTMCAFIQSLRPYDEL